MPCAEPARPARPDRPARFVALVLLALAACRIESGGGEPPPSSAATVAVATDTLRSRCPKRLPGLRLPPPIRLDVEAVRLIPAGDGLLVVASRGGLHRHAGGRTERLLEGGRDYALEGERLVRLEADRVEVFEYLPAGIPRLLSTAPAQAHDVAIALEGRRMFVHSGFNRDALVLERSIPDGAVQGAFLPVERDLLRGLLMGPERLHRDEGILAAGGGWLLHVPFTRDPAQAVHPEAGRARVLELAEGRRGEIHLERKARRDRRPCPACPRRVALRARVAVVPLYAGAAVADGAFWVLRLDGPGASRAVLLRIGARAAEVRAWRLAFPVTPGALAVWRDSLAIAAGPDLWRLPLPAPRSGIACARA